jgi:hypothetical protein
MTVPLHSKVVRINIEFKLDRRIDLKRKRGARHGASVSSVDPLFRRRSSQTSSNQFKRARKLIRRSATANKQKPSAFRSDARHNDVLRLLLSEAADRGVIALRDDIDKLVVGMDFKLDVGALRQHWRRLWQQDGVGRVAPTPCRLRSPGLEIRVIQEVAVHRAVENDDSDMLVGFEGVGDLVELPDHGGPMTLIGGLSIVTRQ